MPFSKIRESIAVFAFRPAPPDLNPSEHSNQKQSEFGKRIKTSKPVVKPKEDPSWVTFLLFRFAVIIPFSFALASLIKLFNPGSLIILDNLFTVSTLTASFIGLLPDHLFAKIPFLFGTKIKESIEVFRTENGKDMAYPNPQKN